MKGIFFFMVLLARKDHKMWLKASEKDKRMENLEFNYSVQLWKTGIANKLH